MNNDIMQALFQVLSNADLNYPVAWPGVNFTPPTSGVWIEASFLPNSPIDEGIPNDSAVVPRGIFQINVNTRPGSGMVGITTAAELVQSEFPKGTMLAGFVRISQHPYLMSPITEGDRITLPVTIPYSG